jgi:hypothetical protein
MNDIICPNCKKAFKVDEAGFASILKQVRDQQFSEELDKRLKLAEMDKQSAIKLAEATLKSTLNEDLIKKEKEITELLASKNAEIAKIQAKLENAELQKQLSVTEAVKLIEKERDTFANEVKNKELEKVNLESTLKQQFTMELKTKDDIIKMKDDEIAMRKDLKLKLSTKMIGETLELHCETEFNKLRSTAFQNAYFEKDNDSKSGTKGDYIYRENDEHENEIISIMFEMKNEADETASKRKNEDFFKVLDKNRNEKYPYGC